MRLLNNLKGVYLSAGEHGSALPVVERLLILCPDRAAENRARGVLLARVGRRVEAIEHLRSWLAPSGVGSETDRVRRLIQRLERGGEPDDGEEG